MPTFIPLPAIEAPRNALLDFSGINNAIDDYRKRSELEARKQSVRDIGQAWQNKDYDTATTLGFRSGDPELATRVQSMAQQQQKWGQDQEDRATAKLAAIYQHIGKLPPDQQDAYHDRVMTSDPRFQNVFKALPEYVRGDKKLQREFIMAVARGYKDPLEEKMKLAQITNLQSQAPMNAAHAELFRAQAKVASEKPAGKYEVINGKAVWLPSDPNQQPRVAFDAGPDISKLPEHVGKAANFAARMVVAEKSVRQAIADQKSFDPTSTKTMAINALPETFANWGIRSPQHQQYQQAAEMWIRAFLRKESGAAIAKDEFVRDFKVYFPQPGDSQEVIRQKEMARIRVAQGMAAEARDVFGTLAPEQAAQLKAYSTLTPRDQGQQIPPDAVRFLKANPHLAKDFDAKYGPNSSKQFLTP